MADFTTHYSDVKNTNIQTFYDSTLLRRAQPYIIHEVVGQQRPMASKQGNQILFRRYESLNLATTPLTTGETPDGQSMSKTDVLGSLKQYGDFIGIDDWVDLVGRDPHLTEAAELLGEQMGQTRDTLIKWMIPGEYLKNVGSGTSGYDSVDGSDDALAEDDIESAIDNLTGNNARFVTNVVKPSTGYNTTPIRPAFVAFVHPDLRQKVEAMSNFVPVSEYPSQESIMDAEWGAVKNVRFLMSTLADAKELDTYHNVSGNNNYTIPVYGTNAFGVTEVTGGAASNIVKAFGSGGASDPLDQRATSGWKMALTATILNPAFMTVIYNVTT